MNFLREDKVYIGMIVAVFFTVTTFYGLYSLDHSLIGKVYIKGQPYHGVQERFISTLAVFFNIIPFIIYMVVRKDNCLRGVGIITVLLAMFMLIYYYILHYPNLIS